MNTLTVIILAKNEESHIHDCIQSALFADEILLIDDYSTDNTVSIAQSLGARIVQHALNGNWAQQRQFALTQAQSDWVLFLDADERITPELATEIQTTLNSEDLYAYLLPRKNVFHHNRATHGSVRPDKVLRLFPKEGATVQGMVHETIVIPYEQRSLHHYLEHYTYDNWEQYFRKFNTYTSVAARQYHENGKACSFWKDIVLRPHWAFIKIYFLQKGCLDGKMGFILSIYHYMYTLTKYVKLYYLNKSNGKL